MVVGTIQFKLLEIQAIFEKSIKYLNVTSTKKMLVAFESFMEVAQSNMDMDVAKAFLHHGYIDVSGCCIWV